jgi:hypothetical protein
MQECSMIDPIHAYRSVHNVRIERLWVNVTTSFGAKWHDFFFGLEDDHGLDPNLGSHIWLLHLLFLPAVNHDIELFIQSWNHHQIHRRDGPNQSPIALFAIGSLTEGSRGDLYQDLEELNDEDLFEYGVDWEAMGENAVLASHRENNVVERGEANVERTWRGRRGPPGPATLSNVEVESPEGVMMDWQTSLILQAVGDLCYFDHDMIP